MTPWPLGLALVSVFAGRLSDRFSAGLLGAAGLLGQAAGLLLIVLLPPHPGNAALIWRLALAGAGFGLFQTPNNRAMLSAAPRHRTGGASGMLSTARLLGQTAGAALAALIFTLVASGGPIAALTVAALCSLAASAVSATRLKLRPA
jgi:DHA2 family multidrug resistance protein-like MFS transporter